MNNNESFPDSSFSFDRRGLERHLSNMNRLLRDKEFESVADVNAYLQEQLEGDDLPSFAPETALEQAQELMYDAWESRSSLQRVRLARKALDISSDCADAYVLLAEEASSSLEEVLELLEKGVEAGERALGSKIFEDDVGHFWGIVQTRSYMRARAGLAQVLMMLGRTPEAIGHYREMLRLNPNDNQGLRYLLSECLVEEERWDEVSALLDEYEGDPSASWLYTRSLVLYRRQGPASEAEHALQAALDQNRHVPAYLTKIRSLPKKSFEYIHPGGRDEAVEYARGAIRHWHQVPGALFWLRQNWKTRRKS